MGGSLRGKLPGPAAVQTDGRSAFQEGIDRWVRGPGQHAGHLL